MVATTRITNKTGLLQKCPGNDYQAAKNPCANSTNCCSQACLGHSESKPPPSCSNAPLESLNVAMSLKVQTALRGEKSLRKELSLHETCRSSGYVLNDSHNLLLGVQLAELERYSRTNLYASFAALVYVAIEITLLILHSLRVWFAVHNGNGEMWEKTFHCIEFWSAAMFNVITGVVLHNSTSDTFHELARKWPVFINRLALLNIVTSFVAALLVSIDLEYFEILSHQIEYVADFCMILVVMVLNIYSIMTSV